MPPPRIGRTASAGSGRGVGRNASTGSADGSTGGTGGGLLSNLETRFVGWEGMPGANAEEGAAGGAGAAADEAWSGCIVWWGLADITRYVIDTHFEHSFLEVTVIL